MQQKQFIFVLFTFLLAWILMIIPLPYEWRFIRPEWLSLVLIYWVLKLPRHIGVITAWCVGFVMDSLGGAILGQYAMALTIIAYFTHLLRTRLGLTPFWQQSIVILVLVGFGQLAILMVQWFTLHPPKTPLYWVSSLTSVLIWPWLNRLLGLYKNKAL